MTDTVQKFDTIIVAIDGGASIIIENCREDDPRIEALRDRAHTRAPAERLSVAKDEVTTGILRDLCGHDVSRSWGDDEPIWTQASY